MILNNFILRPDFAKEKEAKYNIDLKKLRESKSPNFDFDDLFQRPVFGHTKDFYDKSSCFLSLFNISVPTLIIHAKDDRIAQIKRIPKDKLKSNKHIITAITRKGGHSCYWSDDEMETKWYPKVAIEFFDAVYKENEQSK